MVSDILLKMALDRGIKSAAKYLKERQLKIDTTALEVEGAVSDHIKQVVNWSSEINFKDLPNAKLTMRVFVDLEILLMPIKNTLDDSETQKKIPSKQIFTNTTSHVAVLGQPGAGKTTLMKFICQSVLHDESYYPKEITIPILIRLRDLNPKFINRTEKAPIINTLFDTLGLVLEIRNKDIKEEDVILAKERILLPLLEELKCVIILDGFDELTESKSKDAVIEDIKKLILSLNSSRLVLTSRSSDFNYSFENLSVLEICSLNEYQIKEFANKWLDDTARVENFLNELKASPFFDTTIRPLTLGHLCAIFERSGKIPDKPKTVYRKIINLLLEEWDEQRGVRRTSSYSSFELDRKFEFLCRLSYELTVEYKKTTFSDSDLKLIYGRVYADYDLKKNEADNVVREIESHTGLLVEVGYRSYEFAHKSIQEFLCAEHLVKLPKIPDTKTFLTLPNELAIAVTISSNPSSYFVELVLNHLSNKRVSDSFVTNFVNRLVIEKPDFNSSKELWFALIVLYTIFRMTETGQLKLFDFDFPIQFEKFVEMIFKRNKRLSVGDYYEYNKKDVLESKDLVLQLKRKNEKVMFGSYRMPDYIYVKKSFVSDFDDQ